MPVRAELTDEDPLPRKVSRVTKGLMKEHKQASVEEPDRGSGDTSKPKPKKDS